MKKMINNPNKTHVVNWSKVNLISPLLYKVWNSKSVIPLTNSSFYSSRMNRQDFPVKSMTAGVVDRDKTFQEFMGLFRAYLGVIAITLAFIGGLR